MALHIGSGPVRSSALSARIAVADEAPLEVRLYGGHQCVVDDSIPESRGFDNPVFRLVDRETGKRIRLPRSGYEMLLYLNQTFFPAGVEMHRLRLIPLPFSTPLICRSQCRP
ncbi:hypothetical protein [Halorhodospira halophila]|uniref:hypothetical protein n=1 Tax=Halorhodospira halophila TaxID=1053 RepID=UPI001F5DD55B|nr:hypothetical protein [Halorhodospira halophila]